MTTRSCDRFDRARTHAISRYVAHERDRLLKDIPDRVKAHKELKRRELLRLGRIAFKLEPDHVQQKFYTTRERSIVSSAPSDGAVAQPSASEHATEVAASGSRQAVVATAQATIAAAQPSSSKHAPQEESSGGLVVEPAKSISVPVDSSLLTERASLGLSSDPVVAGTKRARHTLFTTPLPTATGSGSPQKVGYRRLGLEQDRHGHRGAALGSSNSSSMPVDLPAQSLDARPAKFWHPAFYIPEEESSGGLVVEPLDPDDASAVAAASVVAAAKLAGRRGKNSYAESLQRCLSEHVPWLFKQFGVALGAEVAGSCYRWISYAASMRDAPACSVATAAIITLAAKFYRNDLDKQMVRLIWSHVAGTLLHKDVEELEHRIFEFWAVGELPSGDFASERRRALVKSCGSLPLEGQVVW